jgi:hypothetical protein
MRHPAEVADRPARTGQQAADAGGGGGRRLYLDGFKDYRLAASEIVLDGSGTRITGKQQLEVDGAAGYDYCGVESGYCNSMPVTHAIVGAAQLSQIVLYTMDSVERARSNTLWMRSLEMVAEHPPRPADVRFDGIMEVRETRMSDRDGMRWRHAELGLTAFNGITGSCWLSHLLPNCAGGSA